LAHGYPLATSACAVVASFGETLLDDDVVVFWITSASGPS
jgi:hypothetical protein